LLLMTWCTAAQAERLTVYAEDTLPFAYISNDKVTAPVSEFVRTLVTRAGYEPDIRLSSWTGIIRLSESGQTVIFYPVARTPERENKYLWIGSLVQHHSYNLYKNKNRSDISLRTVDDAKGLRIGAIEGDVRERYLLSLGFKTDDKTGLIHVVNNKEGMRLLQLGRIDLLPLSASTFESQCKPDCQNFELALPLNLNTSLELTANMATSPETVRRLRQAYQELLKDGTYARMLGNDTVIDSR